MSTASSSRLPPPTSHTTLILPFTPATYTNPSVLLPTIFRVLDQCTTTSLLVLFSTPPSPESRHAHDTQLYTRLARDPQGNWAGFQTFLGKVYACLAAAQWSGGNVLMDVEVDFEGEADAGKGIVNGRIKSDEGDSQVVKIQGYADLPVNPSLAASLPTTTTIIPCLPIQAIEATPSNFSITPRSKPRVVALGGTFDHLHAAHKLLLHLALFLTGSKLIVGVVSDSLLTSKSNASLVQPLHERIRAIEQFLILRGASPPFQTHDDGREDEGNEGKVRMQVEEIHDAFGPTAYDEDIHALVISQETWSGGQAVNTLRREKGLPELELFVIDVIASSLESFDTAITTTRRPDTQRRRRSPNAQSIDEPSQESSKGSYGKTVHAGSSGDQTGKIRHEVEMEQQGMVEIGIEGEDVDAVGNGDDAGMDGGEEEVRTIDLSGQTDEKKLKELKMGSTAIRQWIAEHGE